MTWSWPIRLIVHPTSFKVNDIITNQPRHLLHKEIPPERHWVVCEVGSTGKQRAYNVMTGAMYIIPDPSRHTYLASCYIAKL